MPSKKYCKKKLETIEVKKRSISELLKKMGSTGFQGKQLAKALDVMEAMIKDPKNTIFLGYAGSMSTTGQWKIIRWLIENHYIDVLVSTGANITEDILEAMGYPYYQGSHTVDDADLLKHNIDRYYDVYADEMQYRRMEILIRDFIYTLNPKKSYSSGQFLYLFGKYQTQRKIKSITEMAYRKKIPVYSPGMVDSAVGCAAYIAWKRKNIMPICNQLQDFIELGKIGEKSSQTSVIYIGGGVPKDTIQLVTIMLDLGEGKGEKRIIHPHKYAVQITTDSPQWGGLSGCTFEEAISWGKIDEKATRAVCYCDATIALPIISHGLIERLKGFKRKGKDFSFVFKGI